MQKQATEGLRSGDYIEYSKDELMQRKIENALEGLEWTTKHLFSQLNQANKRTLAEFLNDMITRENPRPNTKRTYVQTMVLLSRFYKHGDDKPFKGFTRDAIMTFLQSYRKAPAVDPKERWISTYNQKAINIVKFYKWLFHPDLTREERNEEEKPAAVRDIPLYKKKEVTSIEAKDLWIPIEDKVFLKYCPDVRLSLYHTMADDTSGRPHELLAKRFADVKIKNHNGRIYGEVEIGRGGKTKSRTVPLITSIPYFKQWQGQHGSDPNSFIFRAFSPQAKHKNRPLTSTALNHIYSDMKDFFKTLLDRPDVPPEDKRVIESMVQKPWNPYIRRHSSLTEKARLLKSDHSLRLHAGWTKSSKMVEIYTHELGGESSAELLAAYGIMPKDVDGKTDLLAPKVCPMCNEPNKPDARFCANVKCGMPLSFDAYKETKEKEQEKDEAMVKMMARLEALEQANKERTTLGENADKLRGKVAASTRRVKRT